MMMTSMTSNKMFLAVVGLFLLCLLAYGNCFQNGFLMDDNFCFFDQENLGEVSWGSLFTQGFRDIYRPVGLALLKAELFFFKTDPLGYHVVSFLIFYSICVAFFFILQKLWGHYALSLIASSFYAAHPINNFFVNYKTATNLSLFILCLQGSLLFFIRAIDRKDKKAYAASLLFYLGSVFSHEIGFMMPAYLCLILYSLRGWGVKRILKTVWPYAVVFLIFLFVRYDASASRRVDAVFYLGISFLQYAATMTSLLGWYLSKLFWPANIIFTWDIHLPEENISMWILPAGWIAVLGIMAFICTRRQKNINTFAGALFVLGLLPAFLAGFTYTSQMKTAAIEPHWFGFTSIGFFVLFASVCLYLRKFLPEKVWLTGICVVVAGLAMVTRQGNVVWKDADTFATYWLETNSTNGAAWNYKARTYVETHDRGLDPDAYKNCEEIAFLGLSYHVLGSAKNALTYYQCASLKNPECALAYYGPALLFNKVGDRRRAQEFFARAKMLEPDFLPAYRLLTGVFNDSGQKDDWKHMKKIFLDIYHKQDDAAL